MPRSDWLRAGLPFAAVALVAGLLWVLPSSDRAPVGTAVASGSSATAPPPSARDVLSPRMVGWSAENRYDYRVKLSSSVALDKQRPSFDFEVTGTLSVTPAVVTPSSVRFYGVLRDAAIVSRVPGTQQDFDKFTSELRASSFFFTLEGGVLDEIRLPAEASSLASNVFRSVAAGLQLARSAVDAESYSAEEYDSTGRYSARYERISKNQLRKQKRHYVGLLKAPVVASGTSVQIVPKVRRSEGELRLDADGRPELVSLRDDLVIDGAQAPVESSTLLSLEATRVERVAPPAKLDALFAGMRATRAGEAFADGASVDALDRARINGLTFEQVLAHLEQRAASAPNENAAATEQKQAATADSRHFIALAAIFRQQPHTIPLALRKIREKSKASDVLIDALGSASSAAAQDALFAVMNDENATQQLRGRAATALGRSTSPNERSIAALKTLLVKDSHNPKALFGLGTFSRRLRDAGDADGAKNLGEFLVAKLESAKTVSPILISLRALANSGYAGALPKVTPFLTDPREQVRVDAVRSLQSMKHPSIDGILTKRLTDDGSSAVRISAIQAMQVRDPSDVLVNGLSRVASNADPHVRHRAVEVMISWLSRRPDLRATLARLSQSEREARIRDKITTALSARDGS